MPDVRGGYNGVLMLDISRDGNSFSRGGALDLCPECMDSLVRWFMSVETENPTE